MIFDCRYVIFSMNPGAKLLLNPSADCEWSRDTILNLYEMYICARSFGNHGSMYECECWSFLIQQKVKRRCKQRCIELLSTYLTSSFMKE